MFAMSSDDADVGLIEGFLVPLLENLGDRRVAAVLEGPLNGALVNAVKDGLVKSFETLAADGEEPFEGLPEKVRDAEHPAEALIDWVETEGGQHVGILASATAVVTGSFVSENRGAIVAAMKAAGQGPAENRDERIVDASALVNIATEKIESIRGISSLDAAVAVMEEARARLEEAREILHARALDDAIMYGANPETAVPVAGDFPDLTPRGRRTDVENLLFDSWIREVDGHLALAAKIGPEIDGTRVVEDEQRDYILDALVAIQEAYTTRPDTAILLRFGRLRLAKGDIGEARMAAEKVMELVPDEEEPLHLAAVDLFNDVAEASPLTRKDKRCFVATAAMDDIDAPEVEALRAFRDECLMKSAAGRLFVRTYYRVSPPLARLIADVAPLRKLVRGLLVVPAARATGRMASRR
jgi:hypothetical protein